MSDVAEWAHVYTEMQLLVLAVQPAVVGDPASGKRPLDGLKHGKDQATLDPKTIEQWFANGHGNRNIGIACGPSQLVVLDADLPKEKNGFTDGVARLAELEAEVGPLPPSPIADTGSGALHRVYRAPAGVDFVGKIGRAIDVIRNGYIVAPPSKHHTGGVYRWRDGFAIGEIEIAPLPAEWIEFLRKPEPVARPATQSTATGEDFYEALASLDQRSVLSHLSGASIVNGERFAFKPVGRGKYNIFIDKGEGFEGTSNFIDASGKIAARSTGKSDGGPLASQWLRWYRDDDKAIRRALIEHVPELERFAKPSRDEVGERRRKKSSPAVDVGASDHAGIGPQGGYRLTDLGNARRFVDANRDTFRYVHEWAAYLTWDGKRWNRDLLGGAQEAAKRVVASIYADAAECAVRAAAAVNAGDASFKGAPAEELAKFARTCSKRTAIEGMLALARSEPEIAASRDAFDSDQFALNVGNGTIDLRTGDLRPHRQADMLTKLSPVGYDPKATAPKWEAFLERVQPDPQLRAWLQRYLGYALTGDVREQCLAFMFGGGANGKSVLLDVMLGVLGEYGCRAAPDLVLAKQGESHPTEVAHLDGKRLVVCSEIEQGRMWAESLIKRITGDTTITARLMKKDFYTFTATHKLAIAANTKPKVRGTDHGIWRRMKLVPWSVQIPDAEQDRELPAKLLAAEAAGILAWLVRGCLQWQRLGLGSAPTIDTATKEYRDDEDVLGRWIEDRCALDSGNHEATAQLYASFKVWCEAEGIDAWTRNTWRARMLERDGIADKRTKTERELIGIALKGAL